MDFDALKDFVAVAQTGSLAAACKLTGVPRSTLSKRLRTLEASLGQRLFERSTRALRLTAEGALLLERGAPLVREADELDRLMRDHVDEVSGHLRISVPVLLGNLQMGAIAAQYRRRWPRTALEIVLSDRRVNLIEEGFDCAVRVGTLDDSNLVSQRFAVSHAIVVACPDLAVTIAAHRPADLSALPAIAIGRPTGVDRWELFRGEQRGTVPLNVVLRFTSVQAAFEAALGGAGMVMVPQFLAQPALGSGRMIQLLPGWIGGETPLHVVYPSRRHPSPRLRAFLELIKSYRWLGDTSDRVGDAESDTAATPEVPHRAD